MRPGIEKEEILGMLTDMVNDLEETEVNLQHSLAGLRADMCNAQSERMVEFGIRLDTIEKNTFNFKYSNPSLIAETKGLKLELGF